MNLVTYFMWISLIVVAALMLLSAIDEFVFDICFIFYRLSRLWKKRKYKYSPLTYEDLSATPEKKIAIFIPCWNEGEVIGNMLRHNIPAIDYKDCHFFIAVYPNDQFSIDAVQAVQKHFSNVHCVINSNPGPSSKADNLNEIYRYLQKEEAEYNIHYDIIVFHDSEDIIHPLSFKLYNYLIPRKDMVQIPIFPLEIPSSFWTYWTYADEFAENHTKIMIVREFIHGLVPCAGVGAGFARSAIDLLANRHGGVPFNLFSLTEDYSLALELHLLKLKSIFLTQSVEKVQTKKQWIWFGKIVPKRTKMLVATRALFPKRYTHAVRQRTRWVMGIALQEWRRKGWAGNWATRYTLFHDRKALFSNFLNFASYIVFIFWLVYITIDFYPPLSFLLEQNPLVWYLILGCVFLMVIRIIQRALATYKVYGLIPALLSFPRLVYGNIINCHSIARAYWIFFFSANKNVAWDKTKNVFPSDTELALYKRKLGELLIENRIISPEQLNTVLKKQRKSKERLGDILVKENLASPQEVLQILAKQFNLELIDMKLFRVLAQHEITGLSTETYEWLLKNNCLPIAFFNEIVTLAITDPANEMLKTEAKKRLSPKEVKFALSSDTIKF